MTKTITGGLSYRKQYALQCFLNGTDSRARDNCFEMGDGDEVMVYLMRRATEQLPPKPDYPYGENIYKDDPRLKLIRKHERQEKLLANLKKSGSFEHWQNMMKERGLRV